MKAAKKRLQRTITRDIHLTQREQRALRQLKELANTHNRLIVRLREARLLDPLEGERMQSFIERGTRAISAVSSPTIRKQLLHAFALRVVHLRAHAKELRARKRIEELQQKVISKAISPPRRPMPPARKKGK
jgi:pimeloyl-CoA synthetase